MLGFLVLSRGVSKDKGTFIMSFNVLAVYLSKQWDMKQKVNKSLSQEQCSIGGLFSTWGRAGAQKCRQDKWISSQFSEAFPKTVVEKDGLALWHYSLK